mmetsp:Transcript_6784/g.16422  ORF Transcript_6784/g.16422 Transcript_6784/m.16422 type:complete len:264 (-) Transcript_6784:210-1001(-)
MHVFRHQRPRLEHKHQLRTLERLEALAVLECRRLGQLNEPRPVLALNIEGRRELALQQLPNHRLIAPEGREGLDQRKLEAMRPDRALDAGEGRSARPRQAERRLCDGHLAVLDRHVVRQRARGHANSRVYVFQPAVLLRGAGDLVGPVAEGVERLEERRCLAGLPGAGERDAVFCREALRDVRVSGKRLRGGSARGGERKVRHLDDMLLPFADVHAPLPCVRKRERVDRLERHPAPILVEECLGVRPQLQAGEDRGLQRTPRA